MVLSFYIKGFNSDHLKNRNKGFLNEPKVGKKKKKKKNKKKKKKKNLFILAYVTFSSCWPNPSR